MAPETRGARGSAGEGRERRRHPRAALDWPVTIRLPDGEHQARLRDVSASGICFFLDRRIPEMTLLRMDIELPARPASSEGAREVTDRPGSAERVPRVQGAGVVVRCRALSQHVDHYEVAVFLNDVSEEARGRLESYVTAAV